MKKILIFVTVLFALSIYGNSQNTSPYWSLAGNSNATSSSKLGTTNKINLRLFTSNVERIRVLTTGLVGINTTGPTARLQVNSSTGQDPFRAQVNGATKLIMKTNGGVSIGTGSTPPTNGLYVVGKVGIGTNAPVRKLQIKDGDIRTETGLFEARYLEFLKTGTTPDWRFEHSSSGRYLYMSFSANDFSGFSDAVVFDTAKANGYVFQVFGKAFANLFQSSDAKLKSDIKEFNNATAIISKLKPKTYFYKKGEFPNLNLPGEKQYGLIAQEVEEVLPELVMDSKLPVRVNSNGEREMENIKAINYIELIPVLIKGMQEQEAKIKEQQTQNQDLQSQINELKAMVQTLSKRGGSTTSFSTAFLKQNTPNPFNNNSVISYYIPDNAGYAQIKITDANGRLVKTFNTAKGEGQINIRSNELLQELIIIHST